MREKELRIALICYGGISLAVYMHGVTKEIWKAMRASRAFGRGVPPSGGTEAVYAELLATIEAEHGLRLRVMTDIVAGASAGGINSVFLAQAIYSGQSLEPLTDLWLECADVDMLLDPEARPWSDAAKFWALPIVRYLLSRPGNAVSASVAPETRDEVRAKLSRLIRSRWFEPPFSGIGLSRTIFEALAAMERAPASDPLLPAGHPLDLFVTATDFRGHLETLRLNSPPLVLESEHRLPIGFRACTPAQAGEALACPLELVFAARATASFPGAYPPLQIAEIDQLAREQAVAWPTRETFLKRIMPRHWQNQELDRVALIDGAVLVNAPFADAMAVLRDRPAHREVDRRFVYVDPRPDQAGDRRDDPPPGFFSVIFGSLSAIPREQPIRDNLEVIERLSRERADLRDIIIALRPEVEETVQRLFGRTLFFDHPTPRRLASWRSKAQAAASAQAGFAYHGYAQVKFNGILATLAETIRDAAPGLRPGSAQSIAQALSRHLASTGLDRLTVLRGAAAPHAVSFFRRFDLPFRIRRLRLLLRRLTQEWQSEEEISEETLDRARDVIYEALSRYIERQGTEWLGPEFPDLAAHVFDRPGEVLDHIGQRWDLTRIDLEVDALLAEAMSRMVHGLRRPLLLAYLGFPFYDAVTLPLLQSRGQSEFDPIKVDRISPDDARSIRPGGTTETLRGVEFYNFGAFFSRAYRENDYLWGRLHGAERVIDLIASTLPEKAVLPTGTLAVLKRRAFLAVLDEEEERLQADPALVPGVRAEVMKL